MNNNENEDLNGNYYDEIIQKIERLISEEKKDEAFDILKEELSQPYIPKEVMNKLENIFENVYVEEVVSKQITIEDAREGLLNLSIGHLVQNMFTLNLRMLSDEILYYLENSKEYLSMSMLLYTLINQGVNMNFNINKFGVANTFNTLNINIIDEELMIKYSELFEKEFEKEFEKDPVYARYCVDILSYYFLVSFPFKFDVNFELYEEVVTYVKRISGISSEESHEEFLTVIEYEE